MITAQEALEMMPNKEKAIENNVQSICNNIQYFAQQGYDRMFIDKPISYTKETFEKLEELGYNVKEDFNMTVIIWGKDE